VKQIVVKQEKAVGLVKRKKEKKGDFFV